MLDSDGLVEGLASIACDPKVAGSSLNRFLFSIIILVKSNRPWIEWQGKVKHWVSRAILLIWLTNQAIPLHQTQTATDIFVNCWF